MSLAVGLSGGVGSGKSTVAQLLAAHGAVVVDADVVAREVVAPGTPGFGAVAARFPSVVVDGRLDRSALAAIVFADADARAELNAIMHPLVRDRMTELVAAAPDDAVVVQDIPLLAETRSHDGFDVVVMVEAPEALRLQRLAGRGMDERDARARMASQASDEQRRAIADEVIVNDGSHEQLAQAVEAFWARLVGLEATKRIG